ncbi:MULTISPECIES: hypothetical protein [unclassified Caballeronia]|uniref:hypothetical protein n=1 Tax=unclassified Caballeronia TaxID=2646786 RepID=UPI00285DD204|nr:MULTISPECIES: hypothetical protein [unclassified Caballeronia]MDR5740475.1 hypothetical protein [Caballeronia sp. LZ016]MDR5809004.1 hypothetical protein [Caballeronia sp. LZ019]
MIPLEFARHSDGEIASLVVLPSGPVSPTYWAPLALESLDAAREALRKREDVRINEAQWIGSIPQPAGIDYPQSHAFAAWLARNGADAVVWTALPPKSHDCNGRMPSVDEAITYFNSLNEDDRSRAETYIRQTPPVVRTPFRERFESVFGWTPSNPRDSL